MAQLKLVIDPIAGNIGIEGLGGDKLVPNLCRGGVALGHQKIQKRAKLSWIFRNQRGGRDAGAEVVVKNNSVVGLRKLQNTL